LEIAYNALYDDAARRFLEAMKTGNNKSIYKLELNENVNRDIITEIAAICKKNTPKGKKKKKKK